jgi:acyl-CoA oxidase
VGCAGGQVRAVEESIAMVHRLRNDVGSYALMAGTGFEQTDFLVPIARS